MNNIEINLADFVSKETKSQFEKLNAQKEEAYQNVATLMQKIKTLEEENKSALLEKEKEIAEFRKLHKGARFFQTIASLLKSQYEAIEKTVGGDREAVCKKRNQYGLISELMKSIFDKEPLAKGWSQWRSSDRHFKYYLLANYSHCKDELIVLLQVLDPQDTATVEFIENHVLPQQYSRKEILSFLKSPHGCTNSLYWERSKYWIEGGLTMTDCPYSELFQNPVFEDPGYLDATISAFKSQYKYHYLFKAVDYVNFTNEQLSRIAMIALTSSRKGEKETYAFLSKHIDRFSEEVVNLLLEKATYDNQYHAFYYARFPKKHRYDLLATQPLDFILKAIVSDKDLTAEEKKEFISSLPPAA